MVGKYEMKKPHRGNRRRWNYSIKMDLKEGRSENVDWFHLAQDRDKFRALVNK